mmetsp:Transcript_9004/g.13931  ORF Transcript_9004/g.13931 Transcript_9004/m.13931 type:complete len:80 (-) Transcript_9004:642-881(-)
MESLCVIQLYGIILMHYAIILHLHHYDLKSQRACLEGVQMLSRKEHQRDLVPKGNYSKIGDLLPLLGDFPLRVRLRPSL